MIHALHTHLVAATVWRWRRGHAVEPFLKRVVDEQLVLISSGGLRLAGILWHGCRNSRQRLSCHGAEDLLSGCPRGDLLMTTAVYRTTRMTGLQMLHFPVPFADDTVTIMDTSHSLRYGGQGHMT